MNFVVVGAQKAGTTSLYRYLQGHPQIFLPRKELDYFCRDVGADPDGYGRLFDSAAPGQLLGDISPNYAMFPIFVAVPQQLAAAVPQARLVYVLRNPVERAIAGYLHAVAAGTEGRAPRHALHHDPYVVTSMYGLQLHLYRRHFDDEQLLVVKAEDLRDDRRATLARVLDHIGADPALTSDQDQEEEHHRTADKRAPRSALRRAGLGGIALRLARRVGAAERALTSTIETVKLSIDDEVRETLRLRLQPDLRWLLEQRPDLDGWGLLDDPQATAGP